MPGFDSLAAKFSAKIQLPWFSLVCPSFFHFLFLAVKRCFKLKTGSLELGFI